MAIDFSCAPVGACFRPSNRISEWPGMWRVRLPGGHLSDIANLTRAKDAAQLLALATLNCAEEAA